MENIIQMIDWFFLFYFVALNSSYGVLVLLSFKEILVQKLRLSTSLLLDAESNRYTPPISIIAPAYNEEATILSSVRALLALKYPEFEVVVVNDDSKDQTLQLLIDHFDLYQVEPICRSRLKTQKLRGVYRSRSISHLIIIDKENGGKADALNCGLNLARFPLFCGIDADTLILPEALLKLASPFIEDPNHTIVSGGTIRVANDCIVERGQIKEVRLPKKILAQFQVVEYLRAFLFGRIGWNMLGGTLIISGAFGLFRRDIVINAGGYEHNSVGEDMELIVRLHRLMRQKKRPYRIRFVWESVCYTEVPDDLDTLSRQRDRWQRGLMDTLWRHRVMFLNPQYGIVGMLSFPFFVFFEMLGPLIEIVGLLMISVSYLLGFLDFTFMLLFLTVSMLFGSIISVGTLVLEEISFGKYEGWRPFMRLVLCAFLENLGYRQMTLTWRLKGIWAYLRGDKRWGKMKRKGFTPS